MMREALMSMLAEGGRAAEGREGVPSLFRAVGTLTAVGALRKAGLHSYISRIWLTSLPSKPPVRRPIWMVPPAPVVIEELPP